MNLFRLMFLCFLLGFISLGYQFIIVPYITPYFGNDIYTWAIVISSFILAFSSGYYLSKYIKGHYLKIPFIILLLTLGLLYLFGHLFISYILDNSNFIISLIITNIIFTYIPTLSLTIFTPHILNQIDTLKKSFIHTLSHSNTLIGLGNLTGILLVTFLLLPLGINYTLGIWIILISLFGCLYFKHFIPLIYILILVFPYSKKELPIPLLFSDYTKYGWIGVADIGNERWLLTQYQKEISPQSIMSKNSISTPIGYVKEAFKASNITPNPEKVLHLGLGGGSFNKAFYELFPNSKLDTIEIDPDMYLIAKEYFNYDIKDYPTHTLKIQDARYYINNNHIKYDWIFVDLFNADKIPFHLNTIEFYTSINQTLTESGVVIVNLLKDHKFYNITLNTLHQTFPFYEIVEVNNKQILFFGTNKKLKKASPKRNNYLSDLKPSI